MTTTELDRLIDTGRQRGGLEIDDIRQALPIDTMSIEEISNVLVRLEEAGIPVEIDPAMLTRHRQMSLPEIKSTAEPARQNEQTKTPQDRLSILAASIKAATENSSFTREPAPPYPKKSATVFVLVAALILLLIVWGVWRFA